MENNDMKICPVCNAELKEENDNIVVCSVCGVTYHQKCWVENYGCSTPGCSENHSGTAETVEAVVAQPGITKPAVCSKCGAELNETHEFCPNCGQKIGESVDSNKKLSKKNITIIVAAAAALIVIIGIIVISSTALFGNDKAAYDLIVTASERFKDPTSVELVSGSLSDSKNLLYAGISATNSYGARNTSYYLISSSSVTETKYPTSKYTDKTALNINKINKALDRKFKR